MIANLGNGIYVGNWQDCESATMKRKIHIYHPDCNGTCRCPGMNDPLIWPEVSSFSKSNKNLAQIKSLFENDDTTFIHCTYGQQRAPTVAIVALMARGMDFYEAIKQITKALIEQNGYAPYLCSIPLLEIHNTLVPQ